MLVRLCRHPVLVPECIAFNFERQVGPTLRQMGQSLLVLRQACVARHLYALFCMLTTCLRVECHRDALPFRRVTWTPIGAFSRTNVAPVDATFGSQRCEMRSALSRGDNVACTRTSPQNYGGASRSNF